MKSAKKPPIVGTIWKVTLNALRNNRAIFIPFAISGFVKILAILGIFLTIFPPLSAIFAPIIRRLWGETFLHYPYNFLLMPKFFYYATILIYIFLDGFLSGAGVWMVYQVNEGIKPSVAGAMKKVFPKYVLLITFLFTIFLTIQLVSLVKNLPVLGLLKSGALNMPFNFLIVTLIETVFAFIIPFAVIENRGFFSSISGSFRLARRLFFQAFLLIAVPTMLSIPASLLKAKIPVLMDKTVPEITFLVLGLGIAVTVVIDCLVTSSLSFLFLSKRYLSGEEC